MLEHFKENLSDFFKENLSNTKHKSLNLFLSYMDWSVTYQYSRAKWPPKHIWKMSKGLYFFWWLPSSDKIVMNYHRNCDEDLCSKTLARGINTFSDVFSQGLKNFILCSSNIVTLFGQLGDREPLALIWFSISIQLATMIYHSRKPFANIWYSAK